MIRRHWPKFLFVFAVLLAAGAYAVKTYPVLTLNNVRIVGTEKIVGDQLGVITGANLLNIDTKGVLDSVMAAPYVKSVEARFNLSGDLVIDVAEKRPICLVYSKRLYGVSEHCEILPIDTTSVSSMPVIRGVKLGKITLYEPINNDDLHSAVKLINLLAGCDEEIWKQVSEILVKDDGLTLILEPGTVVAELGWGDYQKKIGMLAVILAGNKNPALELDLRFADIAILKTNVSNREVKHGV
jgi:hypothetical protein